MVPTLKRRMLLCAKECVKVYQTHVKKKWEFSFCLFFLYDYLYILIFETNHALNFSSFGI